MHARFPYAGSRSYLLTERHARAHPGWKANNNPPCRNVYQLRLKSHLSDDPQAHLLKRLGGSRFLSSQKRFEFDWGFAFYVNMGILDHFYCIVFLVAGARYAGCLSFVVYYCDNVLNAFIVRVGSMQGHPPAWLPNMSSRPYKVVHRQPNPRRSFYVIQFSIEGTRERISDLTLSKPSLFLTSVNLLGRSSKP